MILCFPLPKRHVSVRVREVLRRHVGASQREPQFPNSRHLSTLGRTWESMWERASEFLGSRRRGRSLFVDICGAISGNLVTCQVSCFAEGCLFH